MKPMTVSIVATLAIHTGDCLVRVSDWPKDSHRGGSLGVTCVKP
jgi:hypothetical protein